MTHPAIKVENLGKAYRIGLKEQIPDSLTTALLGYVRRPFQNFDRLRRLNTFRQNGNSEDTIWALKDVSFDLAEGEVVGIIGRNGAGKSTLLKILSRITEPTTGRATIRGRVSSLLEVGTGFHPELTGRENIYLNGTILGMTKREIDRKFDEIVDFSGVEKFLDTPTKRYSSGMQVRLAFAVAAHLEPEILIVDEVLAVGDAEFQKKCLGKMQDVARSGRTVLFVSHNMAAVQNLCTRGIVLSAGSSNYSGSAENAVDHYMTLSSKKASAELDLCSFRESWCENLITSVRILDVTAATEQYEFTLGEGMCVEMTFDSSLRHGLRKPTMGVVISSHCAGIVGAINTHMTGYSASSATTDGVFRCHISRLPFLQGQYTVDVWLADGSNNLDAVKGYLEFEIIQTDYYGTGHPPFRHMGTTLLDADWELTSSSTASLK